MSGLGRGLFSHMQHKVKTNNLMDGKAVTVNAISNEPN